jgi:hypothetical protein
VNVFIQCFCTRNGTLCAWHEVTNSSTLHNRQQGMPNRSRFGHERKYNA